MLNLLAGVLLCGALSGPTLRSWALPAFLTVANGFHRHPAEFPEVLDPGRLRHLIRQRDALAPSGVACRRILVAVSLDLVERRRTLLDLDRLGGMHLHFDLLAEATQVG